MKKSVVMLIAVCCMTTFSGCAFTRAQKAGIAKVVIQEVYASGGANAVSLAIDGLVIDGKISKEQGEQVKEAAQKGYDKIIEKLDEKILDNKEITNDSEKQS